MKFRDYLAIELKQQARRAGPRGTLKPGYRPSVRGGDYYLQPRTEGSRTTPHDGYPKRKPNASDRTSYRYAERSGAATDGGLYEASENWDRYRATRPRLPRSPRNEPYIGYEGLPKNKRQRMQARRFRSRK